MKRALPLLAILGLILVAAILWKRRDAPRPSSAPVSPGSLFDNPAPHSALPAARRGIATESEPARGPRRGEGTVISAAEAAEKARNRNELLGLNRPAAKGEVISNGRSTYRLLTGMYALPEKDFGDGMGTVVERKAGLVLFHLDGDSGPPKGALAVFVDIHTHQLFVASGNLTVSYKSEVTPDALLNEFRLEMVQVFPHLNTAYFHTNRSSLEELRRVLDALRKDGRVVHADLELLGEIRVSQ